MNLRIQNEELQASEARELSRLMLEPLMTNITIGDMKIDNKGNIQYKNNSGSWTTVISPSETLAVNSTACKYVDIEVLKAYDKKIKEYIEERLGSLETEKSDSRYKVMTGESN